MYRDLGLALTASILYTASLPPFDASIAAFAVSCPLTLLLLDPARPVRPGRAAVVGLFFGELTTLAVGGHWLFHGAHGFFGKTALLSALFTLVITVSHAGIFIAASIACTYPLRRLPPLARIAGFASVWVAWEYLRSSLLYGCPWDLLGHAFYRQPVLMQAGALGGVPLLSWVAVITGAAAATVWIERARPGVAVRAAAVACLAPLALVAYGWSASGWTEPAQPPRVAGKAPLRVALVQPNVGRHELWDPALGRGHLEHLLDLSRSGDLTGADLIVWPENAVPFILSADRAARRAIQRLADQSGAAILLGAPRSEDGGDGSVRFFNSIYLFTPSVGGEPAASPGGGDGGYSTYDKSKLLPYVEFTPRWAAGLVGAGSAVQYRAGPGPRLLKVGGWHLAPLICFESTYPELVSHYRRLGAEVIVNVSNDSWFDRGAAPRQHFAMTLFRAVETGLPIVRVANTGVSAVVAADGRITYALETKVPGVALVEVHGGAAAESFYVCHGDAFAWLAVLLACACLLAARRSV